MQKSKSPFRLPPLIWGFHPYVPHPSKKIPKAPSMGVDHPIDPMTNNKKQASLTLLPPPYSTPPPT
jgi:hypothetical protein